MLYNLLADCEELHILPTEGGLGDQPAPFFDALRLYRGAKATAEKWLTDHPPPKGA